MARSAIAFAFLALAAAASSSTPTVAATSRHLLQTTTAPAAAAGSGPQVQSQAPLNLPPGIQLTSPDGSAPKLPSQTDEKAAKVAAAVAAAQKEVVDQQTMRQFQALEKQRDAAKAADPSSDPLNAPRDDVLKTVNLPTADELKAFAESEQVKSFREAMAAAPALPAIAAPKLPFVGGGGGGMPLALPKPSGNAANRPAAHAPPHAKPNAFASKHHAAPKAPEPEPEAAVEEEEAADDEAADDEADGPHVIEAKVMDVKH